jgi:hypothetical protein
VHADLTDEVAKELEKDGDSAGMARAHEDLANVSQSSVVVGGQLLPGSDFDARLATAARLTANLRKKVLETLEYTVSAGVQLLNKNVSHAKAPTNLFD